MEGSWEGGGFGPWKAAARAMGVGRLRVMAVDLHFAYLHRICGLARLTRTSRSEPVASLPSPLRSIYISGGQGFQLRVLFIEASCHVDTPMSCRRDGSGILSWLGGFGPLSWRGFGPLSVSDERTCIRTVSRVYALLVCYHLYQRVYALWSCIRTVISLYLYTYIYIRIYIYVCLYVCIYIRICYNKMWKFEKCEISEKPKYASRRALPHGGSQRSSR